jgi:hypothetical protein
MRIENESERAGNKVKHVESRDVPAAGNQGACDWNRGGCVEDQDKCVNTSIEAHAEYYGNPAASREECPEYQTEKPAVIRNVPTQALGECVKNEYEPEPLPTGRELGMARRQESGSKGSPKNPQKTSGVIKNAQEQQFLNTILIIAVVAVVTVVLGTVVCQVWQMVVDMEKHQCITRISFAVVWAIFSFNFAVNPFIYCFRLKRYRKTFEMIYCRKNSS